MNRYQWHYNPPSDLLREGLTDQLGVRPAISEALLERGIDTYERAYHFFCPSLENLHDPFSMLGMRTAVNRIIQAVDKKERILIFGDYDVDGTTSVAMLYLFLREKLVCVDDLLSYYIPDRLEEGYGLQEKGVSYIIKEHPDLLITVDCGIASTEFIGQIQERGIDCIICDHHLPSTQLPPALAILNPKQKECAYPYQDLCACGIVFKLLCALAEERNINVLEDVYSYLDFVALATAADIVPLVGENRTLTHYGIALLNKQHRPSIVRLQESANVAHISVEEIVFKLAPRINAAGRVCHAQDAVSLLMEAEDTAIRHLTEVLEEQNLRRRNIQQQILEEILFEIEQQPTEHRFAIVLANANWSKGVLGIVASKLVDEYCLPAIVGKIERGKCIASARSIEGVHIVEILDECDTYLERYGGHQYAAGLTIKEGCFASFAEVFEREVKKRLNGNRPIRTLKINGKLDFSDIDNSFVNTIERMQPFGPNNHNPIWMSQAVVLVKPPIILKEKYLKMLFAHQGKQMSCVLFDNALHYLPDLKEGQNYDLAYKLKKDNWQHTTRISCVIQDIRIANT